MNYQKQDEAVFNTNEPNVVYIGEGCVFKGELQAPEALIIDGTVEGELTARSIRVGATGVVKGNIVVTDADIEGTVIEILEVKQLLTVRSTGRIEANVSYGELQLEKGAVIMGAFSSTDFRPDRKHSQQKEKDKDSPMKESVLKVDREMINGKSQVPENDDIWSSQNPN